MNMFYQNVISVFYHMCFKTPYVLMPFCSSKTRQGIHFRGPFSFSSTSSNLYLIASLKNDVHIAHLHHPCNLITSSWIQAKSPQLVYPYTKSQFSPSKGTSWGDKSNRQSGIQLRLWHPLRSLGTSNVKEQTPLPALVDTEKHKTRCQ